MEEYSILHFWVIGGIKMRHILNKLLILFLLTFMVSTLDKCTEKKKVKDYQFIFKYEDRIGFGQVNSFFLLLLDLRKRLKLCNFRSNLKCSPHITSHYTRFYSPFDTYQLEIEDNLCILLRIFLGSKSKIL